MTSRRFPFLEAAHFQNKPMSLIPVLISALINTAETIPWDVLHILSINTSKLLSSWLPLLESNFTSIKECLASHCCNSDITQDYLFLTCFSGWEQKGTWHVMHMRKAHSDKIFRARLREGIQAFSTHYQSWGILFWKLHWVFKRTKLAWSYIPIHQNLKDPAKHLTW